MCYLRDPKKVTEHNPERKKMDNKLVNFFGSWLCLPSEHKAGFIMSMQIKTIKPFCLL